MLQRAAFIFVSLLLGFVCPVRGQAQSTAAEGAVLVPDVWMSHAQGQIAREEYRFSALDEPGVWSAPNRSQDLRSRVHARGIEVFPRSVSSNGANAPWTLRLGTASFGRGGEYQELDCPSLSATGPRAILEYESLIELFQNTERGIEHGWTIKTRPPGRGPLEIVLSIEGDLSLRIQEGGTSGVFVDSCGEARLRYEGLRAVDATGRSLVARLVPNPAGVVVEVADDGAVYPLDVDPLLTNPAWTAEGHQVDALFGLSVSTAGDVNGDGYSDVIVGAPRYDNGELNEGRAYAYYGSPSGLSSGEVWTAESNQTDALFGTSVSTAGDANGDGYSDVIVGAPGYDSGELDDGQVYVYSGSPEGLSSSAVWIADGSQTDSSFGSSVSTAGDVNGDGYYDVMVGAPGYDNGELNAGQAYVYLGSPAGLSSGSAWMAEATQPDAGLGFSVSNAGDVNGDGYSDVIVGAYAYDNGEVDEGRAFVYHGSAVGLSSNEVWTVESNQEGAGLGVSVSTAGDVNGDGYSDVLIGSGQYDVSEADEGRAYVYLGSAAGLSQSPTWTAESDQTGAQFGVSVSTAGDVNGDGYSDVVVGAGLYDVDEADEGRAYAYLGSGSGPPPGVSWMAAGNQAGAGLGYSVSSAGDVNGDGYSDVIVAAHAYDNGQSNEGRVYVYHGSGDGLASTAAWMTESNQANAYFGYRVSAAGDVNGDGYSEVIVGQSRYDKVFMYYGSAAGLSHSGIWMAESNQAEAKFGSSLSTAGDVNGDGYSDVIIGAREYDNGETGEGRAYVYLGSGAGLSQGPAWTAESDQTGAQFGESVSTAGDVNGDGYSDVIVGAPYFGEGGINAGRAYVYYGSSAGLSTVAVWTTGPNEVIAWFGYAVAAAGDVNGDGYSDVIVGAPFHRNGEMNESEGGAYVFHGSAAGLSTSAVWTTESDQRFAEYGFSVSTAGDVNGDGYSDVIVGAPSGLVDTPTGVYHGVGTAHVYLGSASGLSVEASWVGESNVPESAFGFSVAAAGDVNGDGYSDIIVGDVGDGRSDLAGRVFLYLGNNGAGGLIRALQQRTWNNDRPISVYGLAGAAGRCHLRAWFPKNLVRFSWATAKSPVAWLEWEVKPFGQTFDGTGIDRGPAQPLAPASGTVVFDEMINLSQTSSWEDHHGVFHWRVRVGTNNPLFPHTSWFSVPGSNITEAKLRGSPESNPRALRFH